MLGKDLTTTEVEWEVRRILNFLKQYYEQHIWPKWTTAYKNYFLYKVDRGIRLDNDYQTNVKLGVIKMYVDAMWTAVYDTLLNFRVMGRTKQDQKKADAAKSFLEWGFSVSNSRPELMSTLKESLICGIGYGKEGFINNTEVVRYKKGFDTKEYSYKEQYPFINYMSVFDIFHDPQVDQFEKSEFVIHRKIKDKNDIARLYSSFIKPAVVQGVIEKALKSPYYFSDYDYNKVKLSLFWNQNQILQDFLTQSGETTSALINTRDFNIYIKNYLTINYEDKFLEVIEYWEDDRLIVTLNGHLLYDGCNPLPVKKKPFFAVTYNKVPGIPFGHGIGTSLEDIQSITDEVMNLSIDNIKLHVAPMFQKQKGGDIFQGGDGVLEYKPFGIIETNSPNAISRLDLGSSDFSGINLIQFLLQFSEMTEGINSYAIGYQNKVERSATGVSALVQAFKSRLLPLTETLNASLAHIAEMWLATAVMLMDEDISLRTMSKDGDVEFKSINIEDLLGKFDIEFDSQSLKSATREVRRQQLMSLMQIAAQSGIDPITQTPIVDMRKLWGELLDSFELTQDLILNPDDAIKEQFNMQSKSQQYASKLQQGQQQGQGQAPQTPTYGENSAYGNAYANPGNIPQNIPQSVPTEDTSDELQVNEFEEQVPESNILQDAYNIK